MFNTLGGHHWLSQSKGTDDIQFDCNASLTLTEQDTYRFLMHNKKHYESLTAPPSPQSAVKTMWTRPVREGDLGQDTKIFNSYYLAKPKGLEEFAVIRQLD